MEELKEGVKWDHMSSVDHGITIALLIPQKLKLCAQDLCETRPVNTMPREKAGPRVSNPPGSITRQQ